MSEYRVKQIPYLHGGGPDGGGTSAHDPGIIEDVLNAQAAEGFRFLQIVRLSFAWMVVMVRDDDRS